MDSYLNIGISIATLGVILILIFNMKAVRLFIIQIFYGRYSYRYVSTFKRFHIMDNPFPVCIDDDIISHFSNFVGLDSKKMLFTKNTITFDNVSFSTKFSSLKGKGKPERYNIYKYSEEYMIKIMGYPDVILGNPIRELYFLANDSFVMGEYVFNDVSNANNKKLIDMLATKYSITVPTKDEIFFIRDDKDSVICFINSGFTISIQYINLNNPFVQKIVNSHIKRGVLNGPESTTEVDKVDLAKL